EHRGPFLALGRVNGGKDQIVLVEQRRAGEVARGVRGIERELGQELLPRDVTGGDLLELDQVGAAQRRILVDALEKRLVPDPHGGEFGRRRWGGLRATPEPRPETGP